MKILIKTILLQTILILFSLCHAEKVLPVFTGKWFYDANIQDIDSCNNITWKYYFLANSKAGILTQLAGLPIDKGFHYGPPQFEQYGGVPQGFPSQWIINNKNMDFATILKLNPNAPQAEIYGLPEFVDGSDYELKPRSMFGVQPIYTCPPGSRLSLDDQVKAVVCTTTPKSCPGDVVGRNLEVPVIGGLGHVGITDGNNKVIEVLNDQEVIHIDTPLTNFKQADKFWGERYNIADAKPDRSWAEFFIREAKNQKHFDPEYTLTIYWQAGGYQPVLIYDQPTNRFIKQRSLKRAKFRCDTFVNYLYNKWLANIGKKLLPRSDLILPVNTFNSFVNERTDVVTNPKFNPDASSSNFSMADHPLLVADKLTQLYILNQKIPRLTKLNYLLNKLSSNNQSNYDYVMDTLAGLKPYEMIPQLISLYHNEWNGHNKAKIISTLAASINNDDNTKKVGSIIVVQNFIVDLIKNETNPYALHQAIVQALSVLPSNPENYYLIDSALKRLKSIDKNSFTLKQNYFVLLSLAFSTKEMQTFLVQKLLAIDFTEVEKKAFTDELNFMLHQVPSAEIEDSIKEKLKQFVSLK